MPSRIKKLGATLVDGQLPLTAVLVLSAFAALVTAAEPPVATKSDSLPEAGRKKLLADRDRFQQETTALTTLGKYTEAIAAAERVLTINRDLFGESSPQAADTLALMAGIDERREDWQAATKARQEVLAIRTKRFGKEHWQAGDARRAMELTSAVRQLDPSRRKRLWDVDDKVKSPVRLRRQSDFKDAMTLAQHLVEVRKAVLGSKHWRVADALHQVGRLHFIVGELEDARAANVEVAAIRRLTLGENHPDLAKSLNNLGAVQGSLGDFASARSSIEEALAIYRRVLPQGDADIAASLNNLGAVQANLRDYASAARSFREALEIRRKMFPQDHLAIAVCLDNLGFAQRDLRDFVSAVKSFEEALEIRRNVLPKNHPKIATSFDNLGNVQEDLRDYGSARKSLEEALAIRREVLPHDHPDIAKTLDSLAAAQESLRDFASARTSYEEALGIHRKILPRDNLRIAASLTNLGDVQMNLGDYASARKNDEEALAILGKTLPKDNPYTAAGLLNLGNVEWFIHDYGPARKSFEESLNIRRKVLAKDHPDVAASLNSLGLLQWYQHDYAAARRSFDEALAILRKVLPKNHPDIAKSLNNLGSMQTDLHDYPSAQRSFEEALEIFRSALPKDHPYIADCLGNVGRLGLETGTDVRGALTRLEEATDLFQRDQFRLAVSQAEQEQLRTAARSHVSLSLLVSAALAAEAEPGRIYDRVVRIKGGVTAQQRWAREARNSADPKSKVLLERLRKLNEQLLSLSIGDRALTGTQGSQDVTALTERLLSERGELERHLTEQSDAYRTFEAKGRIDAGRIRTALPTKTALIDLVEYTHFGPPGEVQNERPEERRLLAFIVRPDREKVVLVKLGSSAALAEHIDNWRTSYGAGRLPSAGSPDPGMRLRELLWRPLQEHLNGVTVILVSPDGPLNGLPWSALPGARAGKFLIDDYALAIAPVPQLLPELLHDLPRRRSEPALLAVGNVDFQARLDPHSPTALANHFSDLPGTAVEVQTVHDLFHNAFPGRPSELLTGKNATKEAFVTQAHDFSCVVVCTHGFFLSDREESRANAPRRSRALEGLLFNQPLVVTNPAVRSGLVFAGANWGAVGQGTAFLTALEASELDLRRVDLAVLSACETGRGEVTGGEGVLGLQRGFQEAGAQTCVTSLWKVDDAATQALMKEFYRNLWQKKLGKLEALRQAQLAMLRRYDATEKGLRGLDLPSDSRNPSAHAGSPYYWAAFVLSGDWR
jgi:CHAT domain-containing protein/Tfp pilus assembly protein PilF